MVIKATSSDTAANNASEDAVSRQNMRSQSKKTSPSGEFSASTTKCTATSSQSSASKGLVIVIPPRGGTRTPEKGRKRSRQVSSTEDDKRRYSKRPRRVSNTLSSSKYETDEQTLVATPVIPAKKRLCRSKSLSPRTTKPSISQSCSYIGAFELYAMDHQSLCNICHPCDVSEPLYEDLYIALTSSAIHTPTPTARVVLPSTPYGRKFGHASAPALCDPISAQAYAIELTRISEVGRVLYREAEKECFASPYRIDVADVGKRPGVSARTGVVAGNNSVRESSGSFNVSRVWSKVDSTGRLREIFEGYMSLRVVYNGAHEQKGYGRGTDVGFAFWALREEKCETLVRL